MYVLISYSVNGIEDQKFDLNFMFLDVIECASKPCQNGGVCSEPTVNMFACKCSSGYKGINCETGILILYIHIFKCICNMCFPFDIFIQLY